MRKSYKATGALLLSAAGFIGSQPYAASFAGGLFNSGCLAAMVGGLADWFAVTALFHRPLGISYRTEILLRNRERLMKAMVEFIGSDLLSVANIMKVLRQEDMVQMILQYLDKFGGREKLKQAVNQFAGAVLAEMDAGRIGRELEGTVKQSMAKIDLAQICMQMAREALQPKHSDKIVGFLADSLNRLLTDPALQAILQENIALIKAEYVEGSAGRKMMLDMFDLSEERLTEIVTAEALKYIESLKDSDQPLHQELQIWLAAQLAEFEKNPAARSALEEWKTELIGKRLPVAAQISAYIGDWIGDSRRDVLAGERGIFAFFDERLQGLEENRELQAKLDGRIKEAMERFLQARHAFLLQVIQDRLNAFSDEELVEFIESRIADDLQMIRINGSLVGALVGMFLYIVTFLAERMWS